MNDYRETERRRRRKILAVVILEMAVLALIPLLFILYMAQEERSLSDIHMREYHE